MYRLVFCSSHQRYLPPCPRAAWCAAQCTAAGRSTRTCAARTPLIGVRAVDDRSTNCSSKWFLPSACCSRTAHQSMCRRCTTRRIALSHGSSASPRATHALLILRVCAVDVPLNALLIRLPLSSATSTAIHH